MRGKPLGRLRRGRTLSVACGDSLFPFLSPNGDIFPRPGEVFQRASPWQRGKVLRSQVTGMKMLTYKRMSFCICQSLSLWERWHGQRP